MTNPFSDNKRRPTIGIVGGVGPYAGLDLQRKILDETEAATDQEHLPVLSVSFPGDIPDRTAFLLGETAVNPGEPLLAQATLLADMGATVIGIPCNTAHAAPIFGVVERGLARLERPPRLVHMIREVGTYLQTHFPRTRRVGLLATTGTIQVRLYPDILEPLGFEVVAPEPQMQTALVHKAIYDRSYGIKATGRPTAKARDDLLTAVAALRDMGAEAVVLGCTELPLALPAQDVDGLPLIDPTRVLARALVHMV